MVLRPTRSSSHFLPPFCDSAADFGKHHLQKEAGLVYIEDAKGCEKQLSPGVETNETATSGALTQEGWTTLKLIFKEELPVPKTFRMRFQLPEDPQAQGFSLNTATAVVCRAVIQQKDGTKKIAARSFTPENCPDDEGVLDLVIQGVENGQLSKYMIDLQPGDRLDFKAPLLKFAYKANMKKEIGMIAGGSCLFPLLQIMKCIIRDPNDHARVTLISTNLTENDIMHKPELDKLQASNDNIKVYYAVDGKPWEEWEDSVGPKTKALIEEKLPPPGQDTMILICGPCPMYANISGKKLGLIDQGEFRGLLKDMGYTADQVFKF